MKSIAERLGQIEIAMITSDRKYTVGNAKEDMRWLIAELREARSECLRIVQENNSLRSILVTVKVEREKSLRQNVTFMGHILELARALRDAAIGVEGWQTKHAATLEAVKRVLS